MLLMLPLGFAALWRTQGGKQKLNPSWLLGVALDMRTWYWLRRRVPGLVAQVHYTQHNRPSKPGFFFVDQPGWKTFYILRKLRKHHATNCGDLEPL